MMLLHFFFVGLGGAIGSMLRFGTGIISIKTFGVNFPWGTLTVNLVGSFCIGLLFGLSTQIQHFSEEVKLFLMVGILGGFTTFSAFSMDTILLFERGQIIQACLYAAASVILSLTVTFIGLTLIRTTV